MKLFLLLVLLGALALIAYRGLRSGHPPRPGQIAPDFKLPDQTGAMRSLADFSGRWKVLYFYPKDDTPGCTQEACHFRDDFAALRALGAEVVAISLDSPSSHFRFAGKYQLPFPILADESGDTTRAYGALMDFGFIRFAKRYTFLIDPDGRIAVSYLSVDTANHSREVLEDLQSRVNMPKHMT
ncbi:MAG: peroxiredoxin [Thiobacillaceae bacterium]|jgi:peroxiredoxin Q/BCP